MKINQLFVIFSKIKQLNYLPIVNTDNHIKKFIARKKINATINKFGSNVLVDEILENLQEKDFSLQDFMEILNQKQIQSILILEENSWQIKEYSLEQFKINFHLVAQIDNFKEIFEHHALPSIILNIQKKPVFINQAYYKLLNSWKIPEENPLDFFCKQSFFFMEKDFQASKDNFYHDIDYKNLKRCIYTQQLLPLTGNGKVVLITVISVVKISTTKISAIPSAAPKKVIEKKDKIKKSKTEEEQEFYSL